MPEELNAELSRRLNLAFAEVDEVPGLILMNLRCQKGSGWFATVALDDVAEERIVHADDPSLFTAEDEDPLTAVRIALVRAKKALAI